MTNMEEIKGKLLSAFKDDVVELVSPSPRRIFIRINPKRFRDIFVFAVKDLGHDHLCTISGADLGSELEVLYHLANAGNVLSIAVRLPKQGPEIETIGDIIGGAYLYESELKEMFGIRIKNADHPKHLILTDNWPDGQFPLRKDWKKEMLPESFTAGLRRKWSE